MKELESVSFTNWKLGHAWERRMTKGEFLNFKETFLQRVHG